MKIEKSLLIPLILFSFTLIGEMIGIGYELKTIVSNQKAIINLYSKTEYIENNYVKMSYFRFDMDIIKNDFREIQKEIREDSQRLNQTTGAVEILEKEGIG